MADLIVELHVPLVVTPGLSEDEYQYPWIIQVGEDMARLDEATVLAAAKTVALAPHVPAGAFLIVNDSDGDMGEGRRVELSAGPAT